MFTTCLKALTLALFVAVCSSAAQAQSRTWVSGVGNDANPCSRTAPCKTFAGAISKTSGGGEISVLDPGGYGTVTVTKSITIDGGTGAGWGSILASGASGGVVVNAASAADVIRLRNLSINGGATAMSGIRFLAGGTLHVENVYIFNIAGSGIEMAFTGATVGRLNVRNVVISECSGSGVFVGGDNTQKHAVGIDNVNITRCGHGVRVSNRAAVRLSNSVVSLVNASATSAAVLADSAVVAGAIIDVVDTQLDFNSIAVQSNTNQAVRLGRTHIMNNATALNFNGGTIATYKNNEIFGNTGGEAFASLTPIDVH
jgi:hypothetical protein